MPAPKTIAIVMIAALTGFLLGIIFSLRLSSEPTPPDQTPSTKPSATAEPLMDQTISAAPGRNDDAERLREKLQLTQRALRDAEDEAKRLIGELDAERSTLALMRSHDTIDLGWAKLDEGTLKPKAEMAEIYDLDDQQMEALTQLGAKTIRQLKSWENQQAILVDESNYEEHIGVFPTRSDADEVIESVRYRLPAAPPELYDQYYQQLVEIVGPAKAFTIERNSIYSLQDLKYERSIEFRIKEIESGKMSQEISLSRYREDGRSISGSSHRQDIINNEVQVDERWEHLFGIDEG